MNQATIFDAIAARDEAMNRVAANNERLNEGWQSLAFSFLENFARNHAKFFPWEVVEEFEKRGFVRPTDDRAWGHVYLKAAKAKLIQRGSEVGKHPRRHAVATLGWVSLIHKEAA